ncbi:MAG: hypothetical protein ACKOB1_03130, partial [Planctomycetia bacterium]
MLMIALPLSLLAAGVLLWRITRIQTLFRRGVAVRGHITGIRLWCATASRDHSASFCMIP